MNTTNKLIVTGALAGSLLLNSCYFNSAGHIFDKASYTAGAFTSDLKSDGSQVVYVDGDDYYIELPRYRMGAPVQTNYSIFDEEETNPKDHKPQPKKDTDMYRIPRDFAMYLTGKASGPKTPSYMSRVQNGGWIKNSCSTLPIVKQAGDFSETFRYKSPNAPWLYTAGVFDWLCVDLPVTLVENSLVIAGVAVAIPVVMFAENQQKTGSAHRNRGNHGSDACSSCGGDGTITTTYKDYVYYNSDARTRYYKMRTYEAKCEACGGTGSQSHANKKAAGTMLDAMIFGRTSSNGSFIGNFL